MDACRLADKSSDDDGEKDSQSETPFRLIPSRPDLFRHRLIFYPRNLRRSILLWLKFKLRRSTGQCLTEAPLKRSSIGQ
jgi:hypothetical protein